MKAYIDGWLIVVEPGRAVLRAPDRARSEARFAHNPVRAQSAIDEYIDAHNEEGKPFVWTKTADQILDTVKRFGERTIQVHGDGEDARNS